MGVRTTLSSSVRVAPTPRASAVLTQTMRLLALPVDILEADLEATLAANPALERRPLTTCPGCGRHVLQPGLCVVCATPPTSEGPIVFLAAAEDFRPPPPPPPDDLREFPTPPSQVTLAEYVLHQIAPELTSPEERNIAAAILTRLDDDGLLTVAPAEVALMTGTSLRQVKAVLRRIQEADPIGVGSPSPQEAMLTQLRLLREQGSAIPPHAEDALQLGLAWLHPNRLDVLARKLRISKREAQRVLTFIQRNLNPYPARAAWGDVREGQAAPIPLPTRPDIVFSLLPGNPEGPLVVEVVTPGLGLQVAPTARAAKAHMEATHRAEWQATIEAAELLVKALRQRSRALVRLAGWLARHQRAFILRGPRYLKPVTQAAVAQALGVHESTISRAVADKFAQLPNGQLIPLSQFFDRSLAARTALKRLIAQETHPLSDAELARRLSAEMGYRIARRTVAKYRALEGIPPARERAQRLARMKAS